MPLLHEHGWGCDVITLDPELLARPDWDRLREMPDSTRVFGVRPGTPLLDRLDAQRSRWARARAESAAGPAVAPPSSPSRGGVPESLAPDEIRWSVSRNALRRVYGTLLVHGREAAWGNAARAAARLLAAETRYAAILSSGPPHGSHLAALRVARERRIPLVTDFRDPWAVRRRLPEGFASPLYFAVAAREERRVVSASALVLATTDAIAGSLRAAGARGPVVTVMNGIDEESHVAPPRSRFIIAYAGALYLDRDPRPLFGGVAELVRHTGVTPRELEVRLIGPVDQYANRPTAEYARDASVANYVRIEPPVPRRELADRLAEASVLVSFPQDSIYAVPSKLFEYMAFEAWLLVLSPPGTPSATLMAGSDAAVIAPGPDDVRQIARALGGWLTRFRAGERPGFFPGRERFSRRRQAEILLSALEPFGRGHDAT